jgi:hypothetical protein
MTMKTSWFMAGGAQPVVAWDAGNKWSFDGEKTELASAAGNLEVLAFFRFAANSEQVAFVMELQNNKNLIQGKYDTWQDFCLVHSVCPDCHEPLVNGVCPALNALKSA